MRKFVFLTTLTVLLSALCPLLGQTQIFNQPYYYAGGSFTSTLDPAFPVDYEVADNFNALASPFNKFVFYGVSGIYYEEDGWVVGTPNATEPFFIKVYNSDYWTTPDPGLLLTADGTYTIRLFDYYGDGWNGGYLNVYVNESLIQSGLTLVSGYGPLDYTFPANAGDYLVTDFVEGGYGYEAWYQVLDPGQNVIAQDGDNTNSAPPTGIGNLTAHLYEPDWNNPVHSWALNADVTLMGPGWGGWTIYKFEVDLPSFVTLTDGWISAQCNSAAGSGQWFLWTESLTGDDLAHQRLGARGNPLLAMISPSGAPKGQLEIDLGFELWNDDGTVPVELSSFTALLTSENDVCLNWTTQSETGVSGYYLYRNTTEELENALLVSPLVEATNSSEQHSYSYTDSELFEAGMYYYWLQNVDLNGDTDFHGPVSVNFSETAGEIPPVLPVVTQLQSIYPNPFNPTAIIPYSIAKTANVEIKVFNSRGQLLRHFGLAERAPGNYQIAWDGKDSDGKECSSGVYYIVMNAGNKVFQRKAVLMK